MRINKVIMSFSNDDSSTEPVRVITLEALKVPPDIAVGAGDVMEVQVRIGTKGLFANDVVNIPRIYVYDHLPTVIYYP